MQYLQGGNFVAEQQFINEVPSNLEDLKKKSNNKSSWRDRLDAVNELKRYDCRQSRDIIKILALHDPVYKVMEAAFGAAQAFGITKKRKPLYLGKEKGKSCGRYHQNTCSRQKFF